MLCSIQSFAILRAPNAVAHPLPVFIVGDERVSTLLQQEIRAGKLCKAKPEIRVAQR